MHPNFYKIIKPTATPKLDMYTTNGEYTNMNHFLSSILQSLSSAGIFILFYFLTHEINYSNSMK